MSGSAAAGPIVGDRLDFRKLTGVVCYPSGANGGSRSTLRAYRKLNETKFNAVFFFSLSADQEPVFYETGIHIANQLVSYQTISFRYQAGEELGGLVATVGLENQITRIGGGSTEVKGTFDVNGSFYQVLCTIELVRD